MFSAPSMHPTTARRSSFFLGAALSLTLALANVARADEPAASTKLVVSVSTVRNAKGAVGCRLYTSANGFPETAANGNVIERRVSAASAAGGVTQCVFENVAPGTYAVTVLHDENDNRKLDKNFLGIPTEGYGVSNNHTHAMSAPTWSESKFTVVPGKELLNLAVSLRY